MEVPWDLKERLGALKEIVDGVNCGTTIAFAVHARPAPMCVQ